MKKTTKTISVLFAGVALTIGIAISGGIIRNSYVADELKAATSTITVTGSSFTTTDGNQTAVFSGITIGGKLKQYDTSALWFTSGSGYICNSTDLGSISKLTLNYKSGGSGTAVQRFNFGTSAITSYQSAGGTTRSTSAGGTSYDETSGVGKGFFNISVSSKNLQLSSLIIEYITGPSGTLQSLSYSGLPTKTSYYDGESFDASGMIITAHYDSTDTAIVTNDCVFTPNPLTAGTTDINISYNDGSTTAQLLVEDLIVVTSRTLQSLSVAVSPSKTTYFVGESFNPIGMSITATYDTGSPVTNYQGYDYSPTGPLNTVGSQTITITDKVITTISTTLSVQVNEVPPITELFISEYVEGSGNSKAIEIFNGTGTSVNLSDYKLRVHSNGATSTTNIDLGTGSLANNDVYVIANPSSNSTILAVADNTTSGLIVFNGNDAVSLFKVSTSTNIDVIGTIGTDPGAQWTGTAANGAGSTLDKTLVRTSTRLSPNSTFTWSEWNVYVQDTLTYLGSHTVYSASVIEAVSYGTNFLSTTSAGCSAKSSAQLSDAWSGLETSYNALSSEAKAYLSSLTPNENGNDAEHAVARYIYIVGKYSLNNYMSLVILGSSPVGNLEKVDVMQIMTVAVVSAIGFAVLLSYLYVNKKKQS